MLKRLTSKTESFLSHIPLNQFFSGLYYNRIIKKECVLGDIQSTDHVLFIGGGAYPYSALHVHKLTNASVDVIDYDASVLPKAKTFLSPYHKHINVFYGDGLTFDISPYKVIILAKQLNNKNKIIHHILSTMRKDARLLVRCEKQSNPSEAAKKIPIKYSLVKEILLYA